MNVPAGRLMLMGTVFLTASIYPRRTSGGEMQLLFSLVQRIGAGVREVAAMWTGPAAESFMHLHGTSCKRGQALTITSDDVFCHNNILHCHILTCSLAPGRWEGRSNTSTNNANEESHAS